IGSADVAIVRLHLRLHLIELLFELLNQLAVARAIRSQLPQLAFDLSQCFRLRFRVIGQRRGWSRHGGYCQERDRYGAYRQEPGSGFCTDHKSPSRDTAVTRTVPQPDRATHAPDDRSCEGRPCGVFTSPAEIYVPRTRSVSERGWEIVKIVPRRTKCALPQSKLPCEVPCHRSITGKGCWTDAMRDG